MLVGRPHAQAGQLALPLLREDVEGDAGHRVAVELEDVVVVELALDGRPGAGEQLVALHRGLDELLDAPHVAPSGAADLPVLVRVDQGADALVREDLGQQPLVDASVDHVHPGHPELAGGHRVLGLRHLAAVDRVVLEALDEPGVEGDGGFGDGGFGFSARGR